MCRLENAFSTTSANRSPYKVLFGDFLIGKKLSSSASLAKHALQ
jgi:hypothetical protein